MKFNLILIRYGEIALKNSETRRHFENILLNNIRFALNKNKLSYRLEREWGRIYVYTTEIEECKEILGKIFGIVSISSAIKTGSDLSGISLEALKLIKLKLSENTSFALRVTRTGNHEYTSQEAAIDVGNYIVNKTGAKVNLSKPDVELFIEIRNESTYLYTEKVGCTGGFPLYSQGKVIAIVDDPLSLLASWYIMKRGCGILFILVDGDLTEEKVQLFLDKWYVEAKIIKLKKISKNYIDKIVELTIDNKCDSIVKGYTMLENSKEEIKEINVIKDKVKLPILCPLIYMNKEEIQMKCKEIGL